MEPRGIIACESLIIADVVHPGAVRVEEVVSRCPTAVLGMIFILARPRRRFPYLLLANAKVRGEKGTGRDGGGEGGGGEEGGKATMCRA